MKKVIKRELRSNGVLLTFEDGTLSFMKIEVFKDLALCNMLPARGSEVEVEASKNKAGDVSAVWNTIQL